MFLLPEATEPERAVQCKPNLPPVFVNAVRPSNRTKQNENRSKVTTRARRCARRGSRTSMDWPPAATRQRPRPGAGRRAGERAPVEMSLVAGRPTVDMRVRHSEAVRNIILSVLRIMARRTAARPAGHERDATTGIRNSRATADRDCGSAGDIKPNGNHLSACRGSPTVAELRRLLGAP